MTGMFGPDPFSASSLVAKPKRLVARGSDHDKQSGLQFGNRVSQCLPRFFIAQASLPSSEGFLVQAAGWAVAFMELFVKSDSLSDASCYVFGALCQFTKIALSKVGTNQLLRTRDEMSHHCSFSTWQNTNNMETTGTFLRMESFSAISVYFHCCYVGSFFVFCSPSRSFLQSSSASI